MGASTLPYSTHTTNLVDWLGCGLPPHVVASVSYSSLQEGGVDTRGEGGRCGHKERRREVWTQGEKEGVGITDAAHI